MPARCPRLPLMPSHSEAAKDPWAPKPRRQSDPCELDSRSKSLCARPLPLPDSNVLRKQATKAPWTPKPRRQSNPCELDSRSQSRYACPLPSPASHVLTFRSSKGNLTANCESNWIRDTPGLSLEISRGKFDLRRKSEAGGPIFWNEGVRTQRPQQKQLSR